MQKENREAGHKFVGYVAMAKHLTEWCDGADTPWLKEASCHPLQHTLKDLKRAFKNFFEKRTDFPTFKRKGIGDTFRYPDSKQIKLAQANNLIYRPKLGWLRYRNSRDVLDEIRRVTVSQPGGKWFASTQTQRLARSQRSMKRKVRLSNNCKKTWARVQKIQTGTVNARKDFLHKTPTTISQNHAPVRIEDLQIRNMSKSFKGNREQHGKRVKQKSGLNRATLDQGWGEFRRSFDDKMYRQRQAKFLCVSCGYESHADVVGAINVSERGYRLSACEETVKSGRSKKQEPTEASRQSSRSAVEILVI